MRICILTHTFPRFTGDTISSIFMAQLAQSLVDSGNEVWVLTPFTPLFKKIKKDYKVMTYKYIFPEFLHKLGYSETLTNDISLPFLMWILSPFMYFFGFLALLKLVKKQKIDIVNAHWILPNGFIAIIVSLFTGVPVVSTLPGSDVYMARKNILFNLLARIATWKSRWITSNSNQLISDLQKVTQIDLRNKSSIVVYGIGSDRFKPDKKIGIKTRRLIGLSTNDTIVLGVGRLVAKKGFKYLIKSAPGVIKKYKKTFFVLIGDGEQRKKLEKMTKNLKIDSHFFFLGNISYREMNSYYNAADIFILPSVRDEKGNLDDQSVAVMDAMSCAKPVITTNFPGYRFVIKNGKNGFLLKQKDHRAIAKTLVNLIESKTTRLKVGKMARKTILEDFSWKAIGKNYTDLFKGLLNRYYSVGIPKILQEKGRQKIARQIFGVLSKEISESLKKLSLLDVACSSGVITNYLSRYFGKVVGVDVDEQAIKIAKENFRKKNLSFELGDVQNLRFKNNSFDTVVCNQVYNFVDNPKKLLDEIYRVLKPNGICFFGARNKIALIEPQYKIPLLSFFPRFLPFGKNYMNYWELKKLVEDFEVKDYTLRILRNPEFYGYEELRRYKRLSRMIPEILSPLIPNYIWILEKPR